jgi:hypothetical protein
MPSLYVPPDDAPADWPRLLDPMLELLDRALAETARREKVLADAAAPPAGAPHQPWRQALERCGERLTEWHRHVEKVARAAQEAEDALAAAEGDLAHWQARYDEVHRQLADALSGRL